MALPRINYEHLSKAFHGNLDGLKRTGAEGGGSTGAPSQAELVAFISAGMQQLEHAQGRGSLFVSSDDKASSLLQTFLARQADANKECVIETPRGREVKFDSDDILGWAGSLFHWLKGLRKHEFINQSAEPSLLGNSLRIALLADWGTGLYGAPVCAKSIEAEKALDLIFHLGDVYYSGDLDEVDSRFLSLWPKVNGAVSRALNSNHEMYAGGYGYFDRILPAFKQNASYFAYQNDYWLLVGLDTGYEEHDLHGAQSAWLVDLVRKAEDRKVVLFSHHQPYSVFEKQGEKLISKLGPLLDDQKIFAWYWGHEHRCVLYEKHPIWGLYGRCIGHGGFPYFRDEPKNVSLQKPAWIRREGKNLIPACRALDGPNPYVSEAPALYGPNGYVVLDFDDRQVLEVICDADGTQLAKFELV